MVSRLAEMSVPPNGYQTKECTFVHRYSLLAGRNPNAFGLEIDFVKLHFNVSQWALVAIVCSVDLKKKNTIEDDVWQYWIIAH